MMHARLRFGLNARGGDEKSGGSAARLGGAFDKSHVQSKQFLRLFQPRATLAPELLFT